MRAFITVPLFLITILALAIGVSMQIGQRQPPSARAAKLHLMDCALPCWDDLTPGVSSYNTVGSRVQTSFPGFLSAESLYPFSAWQYNNPTQDDTIITVAFEGSDLLDTLVNIRSNLGAKVMPSFGDMLAVYGSPTCAAIDDESGATTLGYDNSLNQMILQFTAYQPSLPSAVKTILIGVSKTFSCQKQAITWPEFRHAEPTFYSGSVGLF